MSKLSERCEERKAEAQALDDKFNALAEESKKIDICIMIYGILGFVGFIGPYEYADNLKNFLK